MSQIINKLKTISKKGMESIRSKTSSGKKKKDEIMKSEEVINAFVNTPCEDGEIDYIHPTNGSEVPVLAQVLKVLDGDTVRVKLCMFGDPKYVKKTNVRLEGIDTPEIRGPEREWGLVVKNYLKDMIEGRFILLSIDSGGRCDRNEEKYSNRVLGQIFLLPAVCQMDHGSLCEEFRSVTEKPSFYDSVNADLITKGYAFNYTGGTKQKWTHFPLSSCPYRRSSV